MFIFIKNRWEDNFTEPAEGPKGLHLPSSLFYGYFFFFNISFQSSDKSGLKSLDLSQRQNGLLSRNQFPQDVRHGNGDVTVHVT